MRCSLSSPVSPVAKESRRKEAPVAVEPEAAQLQKVEPFGSACSFDSRADDCLSVRKSIRTREKQPDNVLSFAGGQSL